jgi:hypothetical protein
LFSIAGHGNENDYIRFPVSEEHHHFSQYPRKKFLKQAFGVLLGLKYHIFHPSRILCDNRQPVTKFTEGCKHIGGACQFSERYFLENLDGH